LARCIDRLPIDEQSIDDAAHLDQLLPVTAVAGETRDLARCHGPNLAEADVGHHPLKAGPRHCAGGGAPKIVIDDLDLRPPQGPQPILHGILQRAALTVVDDLVGRGLTDVEHRLAPEVVRLDFVIHRRALPFLRWQSCLPSAS
jgi:hypothetical protein